MREDQVRNLSHGQIEGHCTRGQNPSLTLGDLEGMGTCFYAGNYQIKRSRYLAYCNSTIYLPNNTHVRDTLYFLVPPSGTWFACSLGLTPCLNLHLIIKRSGFCILVHLLPQVFYFSGEGGREHLGGRWPAGASREWPGYQRTGTDDGALRYFCNNNPLYDMVPRSNVKGQVRFHAIRQFCWTVPQLNTKKEHIPQ